ncbi:MAG: DNA-binding response regulator [spirochete symbiont of Stewartia floridana]|nr:MAG: DNA-binding response regulator [spirochete symbiont of Stewartia floridana]
MNTGLVLITDDEEELVSTLEYNLQSVGYQTRKALTGKAALAQAACKPIPDLIILDIMLPDLSGLEVCRRLRQEEITRNVPILMLSAKTEEIDRVVGFERGADDYVSKPFSVHELMLRVQAILRRRQPLHDMPAAQEFGRLRVDIPARRVWIDEDEIGLTALEFRLLVTFLTRSGAAQSRDVLLKDVWGIDAFVTTRTVDAHIKRLRMKLKEAADYIETVHGIGYRFVPKGRTGDES